MSDSPSTSSAASTSTSLSIKTRNTDKSLRKIELIGDVSHQINGAKLPSNRQVLQVLFYNLRFVDLKPDLKKSARLTLDAVLIYWQQARIPTSRVDHCSGKLEKLYEKWRNILKTVASKRSNAQKQAADKFVDSLDDLFDIAATNALDQILIEEDKQFLIQQRQKGRPGCMAGVDMTLYGREKRSRERRVKEQQRKRKYGEMSESQSAYKLKEIKY